MFGVCVCLCFFFYSFNFSIFFISNVLIFSNDKLKITYNDQKSDWLNFFRRDMSLTDSIYSNC
jgi:hypothetical protein